MQKIGFNMKPLSLRLVIAAFALFLLVASLASFGVLNLTSYNMTILTAVATLVIFVEVGITNVIRTKGKSADFLSAFGIITGLITLLILVFDLMQITSAILDGIRGFVFAALVISFSIEALR